MQQSITTTHYSAFWLAVAAVVSVCPGIEAASPLSLIRFTRNDTAAAASQPLTEQNGPWMIFAASFAGEGAEADARELLQELRQRFKLKAYLHRENYDFSRSVQGLGLDRYGSPKKMRFSSDAAFNEVAVLVGDYPSIDDAKLQKHLQTLKYAQLHCLSIDKSNDTTLRFAGLREWQKRLTRDKAKRRKGPLGKAFATRNPLLPEEFSAPGSLDPLLVHMNEDRQYSLLHCPAKYTVRVASFRGHVIIDQREVQAVESGKKMKSRLSDAGIKAERLTELLRKQGVEAYVFHDRHESIVTVGSFQDIGRRLPNGSIDLVPAVARIIETFGPERRPLQGQDGRKLAGIQPKTLGGYSFEVSPQPVLVPRRSIGADFATTTR